MPSPYLGRRGVVFALVQLALCAWRSSALLAARSPLALARSCGSARCGAALPSSSQRQVATMLFGRGRRDEAAPVLERSRGGMRRRRTKRFSAATTTADSKAERQKKKVLLLMSDTGGGHRASATALTNALERLYPGKLDYDVVDIWTDYGCWPYKNFVKYYQFVAKHPILWRILWVYAMFPPTRRLQEFFALKQCFKGFKKCIGDIDPDLVVSVHPLCQQIPLKVLAELDGGVRKTPFVTVVTDLGGAHPTWFHKKADLCFVPSDNVRKIAERAGLGSTRLRQHGLPLREGFWHSETRNKLELRAQLGFSNQTSQEVVPPMALVVGGGDGVGGIAKVATAIGDALGEESQESTLAVICGKNEQAREELEHYSWPKNVQVKIEGFVGNMHEWMAASDVLVTKAGPGTIAEASTRGLPCLLSSYLPGQEAGNVKFVLQNKFGIFKRRPKLIAKTIRSWFSDRLLLEGMQHDALAAARPAATTDIAAELGRILFPNEEPMPITAP